MTKLRMTRIYQAGPTAALHVHFALLDADAADGGDASELAERLDDDAAGAAEDASMEEHDVAHDEPVEEQDVSADENEDSEEHDA
jgi:hypothetical protein